MYFSFLVTDTNFNKIAGLHIYISLYKRFFFGKKPKNTSVVVINSASGSCVQWFYLFFFVKCSHFINYVHNKQYNKFLLSFIELYISYVELFLNSSLQLFAIVWINVNSKEVKEWNLCRCSYVFYKSSTVAQ